MTIKSTTKLSLAMLVITASVLFYSANPVSAQGGLLANEEFDNITQKIAEKLSLKQEEVKAVFEEVRKEKQAAKISQLEKRLDRAIKNGKLSESQKQDILEKINKVQEENNQNRLNLTNMTKTERRAFCQKKKDEILAWTKEKDLPIEIIQNILLKIGKHGEFNQKF